MKSKKRFLSIFAVLFVAVFAVGSVFMSACKKNKDEEPEHEHSYVAGVWVWSDDYTSCTTTATCTSTTGECDAPTVTWSADIASETTNPTCAEAGYTTYTATYNGSIVDTKIVEGEAATGVHTYTDKTKVEFTWTEDDTEGYKVSATISCAVCGKAPVAMEVTVTGPADGEFYGTYTATATYGNVAVTDTKELVDPNTPEELVTKVALDFSDSSTYGWLGSLENGNTYTNGMLTLVTTTGYKDNDKPRDSMTIDSDSKILKTGGNSGEGAGRYFIVSLENYIGNYGFVSITAKMKTGSGGSARSLFVDTQYQNKPTVESTTTLAYVTSSVSSNSSSDPNGDQTLNYVAAIDNNNPVLYINCDANISIYSLTVEVGDNFTPTAVESVALSEETASLVESDEGNGSKELTATVTKAESGADYSAKYDWTSSDDSVVTVSSDNGATATITAVAAGEATITVRLRGDAQKTATCSVTVTGGSAAEPEPEPEPEPKEDVISIASESVEAGENITAFVNSEDLTLAAGEEENSYVVTGTASIMDASQAGWYNTSDCVEGDYYIVLYIAANGATVSYNGKTFENVEDGLYVIVRVAGKDDATVTHEGTVFTVGGTSYTVSYSEITLPSVETSGPKAEAETRVTATIENVDNFNGASFENQTDVSFVFDHTQSGTECNTNYDWVWMKAEGTASEMNAAQAAAFDPGNANAHDSYVIITVTIHAGEKMVYSQGTKSVDNTTGTSDIKEAIIFRISYFDQDHGFQFKIFADAADTVGTMYVITFEEMTPATVNHIASDNARYVENGWYAVCTECGETFGDALTEGSGYTFTVTSENELASALTLSGANIILASDITGTFEISCKVTINLAGYTISNATENSTHTITVANEGKLTITDSGHVEEQDTVYGTVDSTVDNCAALYVEVGGEAILNGGTYTRSRENSATGNTYYILVNHGTMTINAGVTVNMGATTTSSTVENGWADPTENTTQATAIMTINGGTFTGGSNNLIKNDDCGKLTINGGSFTNSSESVVLNYGELEITGGAFTQNEDGENHSVVIWNNDGGVATPTATIRGGTFVGGSTSTIYNNSTGNMTISGGEFENVLYAVVCSEGALTITGGTFKSTGESLQIYVIWAYGGTISITGGTFTAGDGSDSVVVANSGATIEISGGTFSGETDSTILCGNDTNGILVSGGTFATDPSSFIDSEKYEANVNSDGMYEVVAKSGVGDQT